jgi:hypothetical protein
MADARRQRGSGLNGWALWWIDERQKLGYLSCH